MGAAPLAVDSRARDRHGDDYGLGSGLAGCGAAADESLPRQRDKNGHRVRSRAVRGYRPRQARRRLVQTLGRAASTRPGGGVAEASVHIEVTSGAAASRLLADPSFEQAWRNLAAQCPWATVYQSIDFARTWFACYQRYTPVIVNLASAAGGLDALMVLAADAERRVKGAPGLQQCEYQAWLQSAQASADFLPSALTKLALAFDFKTLAFKYLPAGMNIDALQGHPGLRSRWAVRRQQRAVWNFAERSAEESLRKKSNKSKVSRLGRGGAVELVEIRTAEQFRASLREMAPHYDFRQLALHGSAPFVEDDRKYEFHERLFEQSPPMLHATELRVGSTAVSMVLGFVTGTQIHLAIVAHRADFAV